jgi:hypothetical protein
MKKSSTFTIEDDSSLISWMNKSDLNSMILIFDVHLYWSGECEILTPCFDQMYIQYENAEERFVCLSLEGPKFAETFSSLVTLSDSCLTTLEYIIGGGGKNESNGASSSSDNKTSTDIKERMKYLLQKKGKGCAPLFLAVKDRKVLTIVQGANYPALNNIVKEHIPPVSDDDEKVEEPTD